MRFRLRSLLVVITLACLVLGLWIRWPDHTAGRFKELLRVGDLDRALAMVSTGKHNGASIQWAAVKTDGFTLDRESPTTAEYANGRRRYRLEAGSYWCEFTVHFGRLTIQSEGVTVGGIDIPN